MATRGSLYALRVEQTGTPNQYEVVAVYGLNYSQPNVFSVTELDDGGSDDLMQLGDISGDTFTSNLQSIAGPNFATNFQFIAVTADGSGFIALALNSTYGPNPYFYLFQTTYFYSQANDIVTASTDTTADFAVCFTGGTRIETARGPVAIEDLVVGDVAVTASGAARKIVWIGQRRVDSSGEKVHMAPVLVRAGAFGAGVPERDVFLSPGHPVLVRQNGVEVLVPIMNLINGTTIERTTQSHVTYWHVELDQHDVLLADGLPAESFFDMGSRAWFENDLDDVLANPDLVPAGQHGRCREVAIDGPLVEAERKRLADLFYADLAGHCVWPTPGSYAAV